MSTTSHHSSPDAFDDSEWTPRSFAHAPDFLARLDTFSRDPAQTDLDYLKTTLDQYQEAPYLLEPQLQRLSEAPILAFRTALSGQDAHANEYAVYVYWLSKVVTPKLLVRYFPHSVDDLTFLLSTVVHPTFSDHLWETRYVLILWLSLVVSIPFRFSKLATSKTQDELNIFIRHWLAATGKERDAAASLASRYFGRVDTEPDEFSAFLDWCTAQLESPPSEAENPAADPFLATGILQFLCEYTKSLSRTSVPPTVLPALYRMAALYDPAASPNAPPSPLLRRLRAKYSGRLAAACLPPSAKIRRTSLTNHKTLMLADTNENSANHSDRLGATDQNEEPDFDVPEEVEALTADLLELLSDSDSRVRWTVSKALARMSSQLPDSYVSQLVQAILALYPPNVLHVNDPEKEDLSLVSASSWHGATLCLASFLRGELLSPSDVAEALPWVLRALGLYQRKGAQKIGSAVRDAACYFVWCLARIAGGREGMVTQAQVEVIAQKLVITSCTDEEVSVRRAASAAFQELVGRLPNVPHGLEVLALTDAYTVGSRRHAFLTAATGVAKIPAYRESILQFLLTKSLFHPEASVRELAASSIASILFTTESPGDRALSIARIVKQQTAIIAESKQSGRTHGSIVLLAGLAETMNDDVVKVSALQSLASIPQALLTGSAAVLLLPAVAKLVQAALSNPNPPDLAGIDHTTTWRRFIDVALKRPDGGSHDAACCIVAAVSARMDTLSDLKNALRTLKNTTSFSAQQCVTKILGAFDFSLGSTCNELLGITIDRLTKFLDPKNKPTFKTIEAKRNALCALGRICANHVGDPQVDRDFICSYLLEGLGDYTSDERGDVGAGVRMACMIRLTDVVLATRRINELRDSSSELVMAMLIKQSAERLDSVREVAGQQLLRLSSLYQPFDREVLLNWRQLTFVLPYILDFFYFSTHRRKIISSIAMTVGGTFQMPAPATNIFLNWVRHLPIEFSSNKYNVARMLRDLIDVATEPGVSNRQLVPVIHAFAVMMEDREWLKRIAQAPQCLDRLSEIQWIATYSLERSKVKARISAALRLLIGLAEAPELAESCLETLTILKIRAESDLELADLLEEYSRQSSMPVRLACSN